MSRYLQQGVDDYTQRLKHYVPFAIEEIADARNTRSLTHDQQKEAEGRNLLAKLTPADTLILLDERGKEMTSRAFAAHLQKLMASGAKRVVFAAGGPYGFSQSVYDRANAMISLSQMTFSHEMVRLVFTEQLYRAMTILRGEPYHHD